MEFGEFNLYFCICTIIYSLGNIAFRAIFGIKSQEEHDIEDLKQRLERLEKGK